MEKPMSSDTHTDPDRIESLLTETEAAGYLKLTTRTLQAWRWKGGGPTYLKLGSSVRYRRTDLEDWLLSRQMRTTGG